MNGGEEAGVAPKLRLIYFNFGGKAPPPCSSARCLTRSGKDSVVSRRFGSVLSTGRAEAIRLALHVGGKEPSIVGSGLGTQRSALHMEAGLSPGLGGKREACRRGEVPRMKGNSAS